MRLRLAGLVFLFAAVLAVTGEAKTFRVNVVADPAQMDPITQSEIVAGRILRNVYEGFTVTSDEGRNVPALAERWEALALGPGFHCGAAAASPCFAAHVWTATIATASSRRTT